VIAAPPIHLRPEHALAYLRELQPDARAVAVIGPGGALAAGEEGEPAQAARALQDAGQGRSRSGAVLAIRVGRHAVGAVLPPGSGALAEHDLRSVASAIDVTFGG
jgi:hypothetical protein